MRLDWRTYRAPIDSGSGTDVVIDAGGACASHTYAIISKKPLQRAVPWRHALTDCAMRTFRAAIALSGRNAID